jgi:prefoldin subunit 5
MNSTKDSTKATLHSSLEKALERCNTAIQELALTLAEISATLQALKDEQPQVTQIPQNRS